MKKLCFLFLILSFSLSFNSVQAKIVSKVDDEVKAIADPILDNILDGMKIENYALYSKNFGNKLMSKIDKKEFLKKNKAINNRIGVFESREYLGFLSQKKSTIVLFKCKFSDSLDDVLIRLVLNKKHGIVEVKEFKFQ